MNSVAPSVTAPLLVELFTEELPPRALHKLGQSFAGSIHGELARRGLLDEAAVANASAGSPGFESFATPRRLAVRVPAVRGQAPDRQVELKGPSIKVGLDAEGQPSEALRKWAARQGVDPTGLRRGTDGKQEVFFADQLVRGDVLGEVLETVLQAALQALPIPKLMQYQLADGQTSVSFVRPAHGLLALHGASVLPIHALGLTAGRDTRGHRFQSAGPITIREPQSYEAQLADEGHVLAGFEQRRERIATDLQARATELGASLGEPEAFAALLDEVTALVEWPAVYVGRFEAGFLSVPQECLILTMRTNQKYFPLFDAQQRLLPEFLIVSNMAVADPHRIIEGNERVVRPRLADARFFFEQDQRTRLDERVPRLASVVYHAKLGTQAQRAQRVETIAGALAGLLGQAEAPVRRAAQLAKADLLTDMVGEFPELQGIMGRYYATHDGEPAEVAAAIAEQYQPRFAGDALPASPVGTTLALADKLETLVGLFAIGQQPSGDKDPFALRRHALGVIRMLIEKPLALSLDDALAAAAASFAQVPGADASGSVQALRGFINDRLGGYLRERGHAPAEVAAVIDSPPARLDDLPARLAAVRAFSGLPEAQALAAANKRITNILRKLDPAVRAAAQLQPAALKGPAEQELAALVGSLEPEVDGHVARGDFGAALHALARARGPVDLFFEKVMVMAEDPVERGNRLALLDRLHRIMNRVADISRLAVQ